MSVQDIATAGTSIWLDDLSRAKITSADAHALPARIKNSGVVGVTTNPSIFSAAISGAACKLQATNWLPGKRAMPRMNGLVTTNNGYAG